MYNNPVTLPIVPESDWRMWLGSEVGQLQSLAHGEECECCGIICPDYMLRPIGAEPSDWVCPDCYREPQTLTVWERVRRAFRR